MGVYAVFSFGSPGSEHSKRMRSGLEQLGMPIPHTEQQESGEDKESPGWLGLGLGGVME